MPRRAALLIAFHGVLLVVLGMLVGIPFAEAVTAHLGAEVVRAWRVAHTSLVTAGTLYVAVAAIAHYLVLPRRASGFVTWSLILSTYAFAFAFVVGPIVGARGLEPAGPAPNVVLFFVFLTSLSAAFVSVVVVLWGLYRAIRAEES